MVTQPQSGLFGPRVSRHFGFDRSAVLTAGARHAPAIAMTYLFSDKPGPDPTPTPPMEAAFSIMVQLAPLDWHCMTLGTALHFSGPVLAGAVSVVDLEDQPQSRLSGRFEAVQFYVPRAALNELCRERGLAPIGHMVRPRAKPDPLALHMASLLLPYIHGSAEASPLFVDHVAMAFLAHAARDYGGVNFAGPPRPSLSAAEQQRIEDFMRARLTDRLTIEDIAAAIDLTPRHFTAAFKQSFGSPPYRYLTQLRIEEAKRLIASSPLSLAEIAMQCGFSDQPHFTRVFSRAVGCSPGSWRRLRAA